MTPVAAAVGMIVAQAAVAKVGFRPVAATGMALLGAGSLLLTQASVGGSYFGDIFFGMLVFGLGIGPAFATATIAALDGVAEHESGVASGLSNTAFQLGGALGVAIVSTVAVSRSEDYLAANEGANPLVVLTEGFQSAFVACVVLAGIGVALALVLLGRPQKTPTAAGAAGRGRRRPPARLDERERARGAGGAKQGIPSWSPVGSWRTLPFMFAATVIEAPLNLEPVSPDSFIADLEPLLGPRMPV